MRGRVLAAATLASRALRARRRRLRLRPAPHPSGHVSRAPGARRRRSSHPVHRSGGAASGRNNPLPAGTYTVEVDDSAFAHNFHLIGAPVTECTGESACATPVNDTGQYTWTVTFQASQNDQDLVKFLCDPHDHWMYGEFLVTATAASTTATTASSSTSTTAAASSSARVSHRLDTFAHRRLRLRRRPRSPSRRERRSAGRTPARQVSPHGDVGHRGFRLRPDPSAGATYSRTLRRRRPVPVPLHPPPGPDGRHGHRQYRPASATAAASTASASTSATTSAPAAATAGRARRDGRHRRRLHHHADDERRQGDAPGRRDVRESRCTTTRRSTTST